MGDNMMERVIHTPEGVRDIYGEECKQKRIVMEELHQILHLYHYEEIKTPTLEFFDIFSKEKGTAQSNEMFKLFDRENNTLVLRPDMTPSIARCVSKYFANEKHHIRLCYEGQAFQNLSRLQGKLNEFTQLGAELIGDDTSAADGEMISMMVDCLIAVGLKEFQVSIGHVEYFTGLVEEAGLLPEVADSLRDAIQNKNTYAIETLCKKAGIKDSLTEAFMNLTKNIGGLEVLEQAKQAVHNERSLKAIDRLEKLYHIMTYYEYESHISFDLGMLSNYKYYSGVIFRGYTYGTGSPIAAGGRYNGLLKQFGVDMPSVGFAFFVDVLLNAMLHQRIVIDTAEDATMILFETPHQKTATQLAKFFRSHNQTIQLTRKSSRSTIGEYREHCKMHGLNQIIYVKDSDDCFERILVENGASSTVTKDVLKGGAL